MTFGRLSLYVAVISLVLAAHLFGGHGVSRADGSDSRITISHSACRGYCRVYDLTLFLNGLVLYNGVQHVRTIGKAHTQIQPDTYKAFLRDFDRLGFFSIGECALTLDAGGTTTTVVVRGKTKTVHHTGPCPIEREGKLTPSSKQWIELTDLEARIEATVNSKQWTE